MDLEGTPMTHMFDSSKAQAPPHPTPMGFIGFYNNLIIHLLLFVFLLITTLLNLFIRR